MYFFSKKISWYCLIKSTESKRSIFESHHKLCFLEFLTKNTPKWKFFKKFLLHFIFFETFNYGHGWIHSWGFAIHGSGHESKIAIDEVSTLASIFQPEHFLVYQPQITWRPSLKSYFFHISWIPKVFWKICVHCTEKTLNFWIFSSFGRYFRNISKMKLLHF